MTGPELGAPDEVARLIEKLLPSGVPGRDELLAQLPHASLGRRCGCGCVSVGLVVDRAAVGPAPVAESPVASASFEDADGHGGLLLFVAGGYLSDLEAYSTSGDSVTVWPAPSTMILDRP